MCICVMISALQNYMTFKLQEDANGPQPGVATVLCPPLLWASPQPAAFLLQVPSSHHYLFLPAPLREGYLGF